MRRHLIVCPKAALKERDLTLDRGIEIAIVNELSDRDNTELSNKGTSSKEIHNIGKGRKTPLKNGTIHNWKNCGASHADKQKLCPLQALQWATHTHCFHCKLNHFQKVCPSKQKEKDSSARRGGQRSNHVTDVYPELPDPEDDGNLFVIDAVTDSLKSSHKREIYRTVEINGKEVG